MAELGFSGLQESGGVISDDFLREWRLPESYKRADEMRRNSPIIGALLSAVDLAIRKVEWTLTSEEGEDDPRLEVWQATLDHIRGGWPQFISEAMTTLPFGFSLFEIVWGRWENYVIVDKLAPRGQDTVYRWLMQPTGELEGFVQMAAPRYQPITIPIEKLLHIRTRSERGNPEGRSILRTAWLPYYYSKQIAKIEAIGIERDLAGMPTVTLPQGASVSTDANSDASKAAKMVRNIRRDEQEGIVLPYGWTLTLLSTGGSRQFDTDKILGRYYSQILMTSLAQFLMLGQNSTGAYALSKDQTDLFNMAVNSIADLFGEAIEDQLIPRLMRLNGYDAEGLTYGHSPAGDADLEGISGILASLKDLLTWTPADEEWLRNVANLRPATVEEIEEAKEENQEKALEIAQGQQPQPGQPGQPNPNRVETAENEQEAEDDEEADDMTAERYAARPDGAKRTKLERELERNVQTWLRNVRRDVQGYAKK